YPEATEERCTVALLLEVDPIALARGARGSEGLGQYVNDRPYAASSLLAVALGKAFASARRGVSKERAELAETALPPEVHLTTPSPRNRPTGRCRWCCSGTARCSPRCARPARPGCSTSAAATAPRCGRCSTSGSSPRSSASTSAPVPWRSPPAGCTSTGCPTA